MSLRFGVGSVMVAVPVEFPFAALLGTELSIADLPLLPDGLRDAVCEGVVTTLTALLPEHGAGTIGIIGRGPWPDLTSAASLRWFRIVISGLADESAVVDIGTTLPTLARIFGDPAYGPLAPRAVWPGLGMRLTRDLFVTLGRIDLSVSALRALMPGSVIVLPGGLDADTARLRSGDMVFDLRRAQGGWTCHAVGVARTRSPFRTGGHMSEAAMNPDPSDMADEATARRNLADVPICIDLDLGHVTVALSEVEAWQVGSVVALDPTLPREGVEVALRANGRMIGTGDLIRIDDRLGVRISRLALA
ncbi:FliM/FliN family flagellar motor switch protein [uncultured Methylobacterium sp.]|uniref:FliM/FliN family flagellar motor switch protein n=1 Tax=uncultured Methylobacterium sp. TaxID=157278 RepID=UPI0035CC0736